MISGQGGGSAFVITGEPAEAVEFALGKPLLKGPADEIIGAAATEQRINLLVIGAYGHSRLREFVLGSTTTTLIRTLLTPVLVFR